MKAIRKALEKRLKAIAPTFETAFENAAFTPTPGTPYQKVYLLPATPDNQEKGSTYFERGIFQVTLCYPKDKGPGDAETKAAAIRAAFKKGTSSVEDGVRTLIILTPRISAGFPDGDRYCIPISITWQSQIST